MVVKDGYSPQEFYVAGSKQAPCSDLYGLAATFYFLLTGDAPPNSQTRVMDIASGRPDPCAPLVGRVSGYDDAFLAAIDTALSIHPADRLQSASKWRSLIETTRSASEKRAKPIARDVTLEFEMSLSQLVEETNDEVWRASEKVAEPMPVEPPQPVRPIGVLLGLLVSLGLVAGLNAVDGSKPAGAAKPATGGLEMKGSIVP